MATRATIRDLAQLHSDQDASDFPTVTQYNTLLDSAGKRVWYDLFKAGWPIDFSTTTLTPAGSTTVLMSAGIPTPTTPIAAIHGVYFVQGGERFPLHRINEGNRAGLTSTSSATGYSEYYDVRINATGGYVIEFLPKSSGVYSVDYIPGFAGFSSDGTVWPGPDCSDELVALRAAMGGVRKEGEARLSALRELKEEYADTLREITDMASWINYREPAMIRDVMSNRPRSSFDYPVAGPGDY